MGKFKIEIKWAIIFALTTLLWIFIERLLGLHDVYIDQHPIYTNIFAIFAIAIYVFALLDKRKNFYQGKMTYIQGLISGLIITGIVVVLSPLTQFLISTVISPEYFTNVIEYTVSEGIKTQAEAEAQFSLQNYMVQAAVGAAIMGSVTSLIVAFFTRSTPQKEE